MMMRITTTKTTTTTTKTKTKTITITKTITKTKTKTKTKTTPHHAQDQVRLYIACICSILNVVSGLAGGKSVAEQAMLHIVHLLSAGM